MRQLCVTVPMGKRLIGKGMVRHPAIERILAKGILVIIAGTTNGYVAEEILAAIGQDEGFSREGFRRGVTMAPGAKPVQSEFIGDVVICNGQWQKGKTIFDVANDLNSGDVVLKGGNALDPKGQAAVQIGHPRGGTITATIPAVVGRRVQLIIPIGVEKRVLEDVNVLARRCNGPDADGPRLLPMPGIPFTELDAIRLMTGAEPCLIAAGGICGAEGSAWIGVNGSVDEINAAADIVHAVSGEPPCVV